MKYRTNKNIDLLAKESVDQIDINTLAEMVQDQLKCQYESMSTEEFNEVWVEVFGEE